MDIEFVRQHIPGLWLLTNRPWAEMQVKASGAAVLTPSVNPSGWFQGFANAKPICMSKVRVVDASTPTKPSDALSAESLADDLFRRIAAPDLIAFPPVFHEDLICQSPWSAEDLARVLNHNLLTIRQPVTMESLPTPRDVSLEMLYGLVLSRWTEARDIIMLRIIAVSVPLLTATSTRLHVEEDAPSVRKVDRLVTRILQRNDWRKKLEASVEGYSEALDARDVVIFKQVLNHAIAKSLEVKKQSTKIEGAIYIGAKIRKKLRYMVRQIEKLERYYDHRWEVMHRVKQLKTGETIDYRASGDIDLALLNALDRALMNIPTDIQISNMGKLRDPSMHFLHSFLKDKAKGKDNSDQKDANSQLWLLEILARDAQALKSFGLYHSDWKNNIASMWNKCRRGLDDKDFQIGPAHWDLALDLYPCSHAFSFTYGRSQGYAQRANHEESLNWLLNYANIDEITYFVSLISLDSPPEPVTFLSAIPNNIRAAAQALVPWENVSRIDVSSILTLLDVWLDSLLPEENNEISKVCKNHVRKKRISHWLACRTCDSDLRLVSVNALFDVIMLTFDGPAAFSWRKLNNV